MWAPRSSRVEVVLEDRDGSIRSTHLLDPDGDGYFRARVAEAAAGDRYRFRLDGSEERIPDLASRFQPDGPFGPSELIDPGAFEWTDGAWEGIPRERVVLYEMHVGAFTPEGTWEAAARELPELARTGITTIEVMPVADFAGRFGWGYDGVCPYAPTRLYGTPDQFRSFVNRAHTLGIGVILDVVYNHLGLEGSFFRRFTDDYFSDRHKSEWGDPLNFDGPRSGPVREFFIENAGYWIEEFHLDGLRLDATQQIFDLSEVHILSEIAREARRAAGTRKILLVAENEPQHSRLVRSAEAGGHGLDALWNDDFHHSAMVAMTGRREAYYSDYRGRPQELISAVKRGFLYQGQWYSWQKKGRGSPAFDLPPQAFVHFLQNHDQVANTGRGLRMQQRTSLGRARAMTALLLLAPQIPMLFMGQEYFASTPFLYFADHERELAASVAAQRKKFLAQFPSLANRAAADRLADPAEESTFLQSKLDPAERQRDIEIQEMHRNLLTLRRDDAVFSAPRAGGVDGAVLGEEAFVLRFFGSGGDDRLLLVNLGIDLHLPSLPEPLLAPPEGCDWETLVSTEDPAYGGGGCPAIVSEKGWTIPGHAAFVMVPVRPRRSPGEPAIARAPASSQGTEGEP
ncbi:MAG: malto-oligosyltrehalose trehalohydrolase [Candidatus Eisenbacteria bacterium]|nr:malto-oligosyltrehalose trehalohydrolase [Candidatus Eisenbacteria bacterium]